MNTVENIKILVADDTPANVKIIEKFIQPRGYTVIVATDGVEAVDKFKEHSPDIVLMDIMMPNKDGYEAAKEIKELSAPHWVPLIFLSAKTTIDDQIVGIKVGGDDYLTKPVDLRMLEAKLNAMMRIVDMQRQLKQTSEELQIYYNRAEEEMELAKSLMENLTVQRDQSRLESISLFTNAAENISGDIIVTNCSDPNQCFLMLADATGHGLTAAISQIPVTQIFFHMVEKGYSIKSIAQRINKSLNKLLPPDRFVAATLVHVDFKNKMAEVWNGSNPRPIFVSKSGEVVKVFEQTNFALGIVDDTSFMSNVEYYQWEDEGELLIYSDGLIDVKDPIGQEYGFKRLLEFVKSNRTANPKDSLHDAVLNEIETFKDKTKKFDDVSLLTVKCQK